MSSLQGNDFSITQDPHVGPVDLTVSKRWPAVCPTLSDEFLLSSAFRGHEKGKASHRVIVCHLALSCNLRLPCNVALKGIAGVFGEPSIEAANPVSKRLVDIIL